jgi:hypothetical protein
VLRSCSWLIAPRGAPQAVGPGVGVAVGVGAVVGLEVAVGGTVGVSIVVGAAVGVGTAEGLSGICVAWSVLGGRLPAAQPAHIIDSMISITYSVFRYITTVSRRVSTSGVSVMRQYKALMKPE